MERGRESNLVLKLRIELLEALVGILRILLNVEVEMLGIAITRSLQSDPGQQIRDMRGKIEHTHDRQTACPYSHRPIMRIGSRHCILEGAQRYCLAANLTIICK